MFKVNDKDTSVFIVDFEHISHLFPFNFMVDLEQ